MLCLQPDCKRSRILCSESARRAFLRDPSTDIVRARRNSPTAIQEGDPLKKREMQKYRKTLEEQRNEILVNARKTLSGEIHLDPDDFPDEIDTASSEMNLAFQGRLRERERGLLSKINQAIERIEQGSFGECESCGEDISTKRMQARPSWSA